jgi:hypothetical protein
MNIRLATETDMRSINTWSDLLVCSGIVYVVPGVACASLVLMATNEFAFLNNLVANPHVSALTRQKALDALFAHICDMAAKNGIKNLIGFTTNKSTMRRAERYGFKCRPDIMFLKEF